MSISGRRFFRAYSGPKKVSVVSRLRRTREDAYTTNWPEISAEVIRRAGGRCQQCKKTRKEAGCALEAHHIIPIASGGKTCFLNLKCLCEKCHKKQPRHNHLR